MTRIYGAPWVLFLLAGLLLPAPAAAKKSARVGVLLDDAGPHAMAALARIKKEVLALTSGEFEVSFPADRQVAGGFSASKIDAGLKQLLAAGDVDLVLALGPLAAHAAGRLKAPAKPLLATPVFDPVAQGIPLVKGKSGRKNFTYLTTPLGFQRSVLAFHKMVSFSKLAVFLHQSYVTTFPGIGKKITANLASKKIEVVFVPVGAGSPALPEGCDAAYLVPNGMAPAALTRLVTDLTGRRTPTFTNGGRDLVNRGVLIGLSAEQDMARRARRMALNVQRVLLREDPGKFNVVISDGAPRLFINMATARKVGFRPTWDVLSEAELLGRKSPAKISRLTQDHGDHRRGIDPALARRRANVGAHGHRHHLRPALLHRADPRLRAAVLRAALPGQVQGVRCIISVHIA